MRIDRVTARSIPDTRERPTVEATLYSGSLSATASVPSGESTGSHEACELRDPDGGVSSAVANITGEIARALIGKDFDSPDDLDTFLIGLDGTANKSRLGANAILSVSIAAERLLAAILGIPLWEAIAKRAGTTPGALRLYVNIINGGVHADFKLPFQEYLLVVEGTIHTAYLIAQEAFAKIGERLGPSVSMGDEGGYAPVFKGLDEPFELLATLTAEYTSTSIAIDAAANELRDTNGYRLLEKFYTPEELIQEYERLATQFSFHSIEDPFSEDAGADFAHLTAALGGKVFIVGDDLTVTNPARIETAAREKQINAVIIKPNQIGTIKEAIAAVHAAYAAGWKVIASHRSGETGDTFIADFAYGVGAHGIKAGGFGQRERLAKYDRLLAIEREAESKY